MTKNSVAEPTPRFVFAKSCGDGPQYLRLTFKDKLNIEWTLDKLQASHYSSKYSAKTHLSVLRQNYQLPESMTVEQV